jgi:hypothetical protein
MSVEIQEFLSGSSSSFLLSGPFFMFFCKEKAPQVNANESVKIPIRIKKLYNHNVSPHRRREEKKIYRKNIKRARRREEERSKKLPAFGVIPIYLLSSS